MLFLLIFLFSICVSKFSFLSFDLLFILFDWFGYYYVCTIKNIFHYFLSDIFCLGMIQILLQKLQINSLFVCTNATNLVPGGCFFSLLKYTS